MNRYDVRFESADQRVWEVTLKADGMSETADLVVFWYGGFLGMFRRNVHFIAKSKLISALTKVADE